MEHSQNLKTPSLGLVWANQISARIAIIKERGYGSGRTEEEEAGMIGGADWNPRTWRRWMRVAFAPWVASTREQDMGVEFEIWSGGLKAVEQVSAGSTKE